MPTTFRGPDHFQDQVDPWSPNPSITKGTRPEEEEKKTPSKGRDSQLGN